MHPHTPGRRSRVLLVVLTIAAVVLAGLTTAPAGAAAPGDIGAAGAVGAAAKGRSSGFTTRVAPGWIGAYSIGSRRVFRLHKSKGVVGRYGPVTRLTTASVPHTRAAYILSKYGDRGGAEQSAAVDAAVLHLLAGRAYRIDGRIGRVRIKQTGRARRIVRSYAQTLLREAAERAGRPVVSMTATPAQVDAPSRLTFTLLTASGKPVPERAVTFTYNGRTSVAITDRNGVALTTVTAAAGAQPAVGAVAAFDWQLAVRRSPRGSTVALAGTTQTLTASATVTGATSQTISIANGASATKVGTAITGTFTITGGSGSRAVRYTLYGPAANASLGCSGTPAFTKLVTATTSPYKGSLAGFKASTSGYYRWGVTAGSNESSNAGAACGPAFKAQKSTATSHKRPSGYTSTVKVGANMGVDVTVAGYDRSELHQVVSVLYGPFNTSASAKCVSSKRLRQVTRSISNNGSIAMPRTAAPNQVGKYFVWQSTLSNGDLIAGSASSCSVPYRVVS